MVSIRKRVAARIALSRLLVKSVPGTRDHDALQHVLASNDRIVKLCSSLNGEMTRRCGSSSEGTFIEQLEKFLITWGPTIIKICVSILLMVI